MEEKTKPCTVLFLREKLKKIVIIPMATIPDCKRQVLAECKLLLMIVRVWLGSSTKWDWQDGGGRRNEPYSLYARNEWVTVI